MTETSLKIAVFIDFDNIEIGVKTTLNQQFDIAAILEGIKERGEVVTKVAYGDWKRAGDYGRLLSQHAIRMVQRNLTPGGDKNGADINLALDALEMAFTHHHINAFVIVGGDSDFITLVEKLKQYDKKVFVVGGRQFTSLVMQKNCHEFIAYENLVSGRRPSIATERRSEAAQSGPVDVAKAVPLVRRALKVLVDREVSPQLGLLKSTLLQLDSTFSERDYGASTFRDFIEKMAKTGIVTLRHAGRSMLVDLAESNRAEAPANGGAASQPDAPAESAPAQSVAAAAPRDTASSVVDPAQAQEAIQYTRDLFLRASQPPRWPMYMRQVKQYLRVTDESFDERKWGFGTIVEFLRACQREGLFRLERDRKGILRVFPGANLQPSTDSLEERGTLRAVAIGEPMAATIVEPQEQNPEQNLEQSPEERFDGQSEGSTEQVEVADSQVTGLTGEAAHQDSSIREKSDKAPRARSTRAPRPRKVSAPGSPTPRRSATPRAASPRKRRADQV